MVQFKKKFYFFKVTDTWFTSISTWKNLFSLRSYSFIQGAETVKNKLCIPSESHTIEIDLLQDIESIQSQFKNTIKQEIKKAANEGIQCEFKKDNATFISFFNEFAAAKNIYPAQPMVIQNLDEHFVTSFATYNGMIIVAHSYILDKDLGVARLFQSASKRLDEHFDKKLIGMANKLLTAKDILFFKELGLQKYDLGGYAFNTTDKSLKGINEFKQSFGGTIVKNINFNSLPYFLLRKLSEKLDRRYS
jgi:hypothetical protein